MKIIWFLLILILFLFSTYREGLCLNLKSYPPFGDSVIYINTREEFIDIIKKSIPKGQRVIFINNKKKYKNALLKLNYDVNDPKKTELRVESNMKVYYVAFIENVNVDANYFPIQLNRVYENKDGVVSVFNPDKTISCL